MRDKSLGSLIFVSGLIGVIVYIYWLFGPSDPEWLFIINGVRWAIVLPIACVVLGIFFVGMWIGWTMAVTPPVGLIEEERHTEEGKEEK
ncbi:hypothetical protein KAI11_02565 [Candidatus Bathyarchaeota archaeon]|jgi:hypothetical protein|nr:hypothetical protein [Candidatus Bathyarchaeota archaeon]